MFRKVIVFGLFEMIQKKKERNKERRVRTASPSPGSASGSGRVRRLEPSHDLQVCIENKNIYKS